MFIDPFIFTPPKPDALTRAVKSYQRVACARFTMYYRDAQNPDLLPLNVRGDTLEPSSKQLHSEIRVLRHLTAIQRTLRDIGGPLFNPRSPIPPRKRFDLVERRLDAIEEAWGDFDDSELTFVDETPGTPSTSSASSSHSSPGDFELYTPRPGDDLHYPPEIGDLLDAVDFAQQLFAARADLLDKRRLNLSPEDFLLEITALRDLTAIIKTLRRMSAYKLPEDEPLPESDPESEDSSLGAPSTSSASSCETDPSQPAHEVSPNTTSPEAYISPTSSNSSSSSNLVNHVNPVYSPSSVPRVPEVRSIKPRNTPTLPPEPETPHASDTPPDSEISNLKSEIPEPAADLEFENPQTEIPDVSPSHSSASDHSSQILNFKSEIPLPTQSPSTNAPSSNHVNLVNPVDDASSPPSSMTKIPRLKISLTEKGAETISQVISKKYRMVSLNEPLRNRETDRFQKQQIA